MADDVLRPAEFAGAGRNDRISESGRETYPVAVICGNCGGQAMLQIPKGTRVSEMECPRCGVKELRR